MAASSRSFSCLCRVRTLRLPRPEIQAFSTLPITSSSNEEKRHHGTIDKRRLRRLYTTDTMANSIPYSQSTDNSDTSQRVESRRLRREEWKPINLKEFTEKDGNIKWFPPEVYKMYQDVLRGNIDKAWEEFNRVIREGEEGVPSASIWHWYVMIGLVARDASIPIENVHKMVEPMLSDYGSSAIFRSLKNRKEKNGRVGQQIALYFTLIHNLRIRMTKESLLAVLHYFEEMMERNFYPSSRHVNVLCIALIHLGQSEQAMQTLHDWFGSSEPTAEEQDKFGWSPARSMDHYTSAMIMFALIQEGQSLLAYKIFKYSVKKSVKIPITSITLKLLLWAAIQPYEAIAANGAKEDERNIGEVNFRDNMSKWQSQIVWDGIPSCVKARNIFQKKLFACYPELKSVENPLYQYREADGRNIAWRFYSRLSRFGLHISKMTEPLFRWQSYNDQEEEGEEEELLFFKQGLEIRHHPDGTPYDTVFNEGVFDKYVELLPFVGIYQDVPWSEYLLVLAWMKHLNLRPTETILIRACWAIDHLVPVVTESFHSQSPAGPLHDYLVDWLGQDCIPHPGVIGAYIRNRHGKDW